jgi:Ca-activated chloride channel family protein
MHILRSLLLALVLTSPFPGRACDLALVLAVDVSGSVDAEEYGIQMQGLAAALRDGVIAEALVQARAEILLLQWTGASRQEITLPWTRIDDFAALDALSDRIADAPRSWRNYSTAIGEALAFAIPAFDAVPHCTRRLIDLSGDGQSNEGIPPLSIHDRLRQAGITVNAIAIEASEPDLTAYFFENVIFGEGAFVETARSFGDYPLRIRRKLLREVTRQSAELDAGGQIEPVLTANRIGRW